MKPITESMLSALIAAQVAVLEWDREELSPERSVAALDKCVGFISDHHKTIRRITRYKL